MQDAGIKVLSDITIFTKYARFIPELSRRETWSEIVERNASMHIERFPHLEDEIRAVYESVHQMEVLPSMRSMQFGGQAILRNHARLYNCSFMAADDVAFFRELMFLLLSGSGVGYSVQKIHTEKLPVVMGPKMEEDSQWGQRSVRKRYVVGDDIIGWANSVD